MKTFYWYLAFDNYTRYNDKKFSELLKVLIYFKEVSQIVDNVF